MIEYNNIKLIRIPYWEYDSIEEMNNDKEIPDNDIYWRKYVEVGSRFIKE